MPKSGVVFSAPSSPSARKVWIEMQLMAGIRYWCRSPSARKVWIEIVKTIFLDEFIEVTFRKEGVD